MVGVSKITVFGVPFVRYLWGLYGTYVQKGGAKLAHFNHFGMFLGVPGVGVTLLGARGTLVRGVPGGTQGGPFLGVVVLGGALVFQTCFSGFHIL